MKPFKDSADLKKKKTEKNKHSEQMALELWFMLSTDATYCLKSNCFL